jgi:hypothetical protein
MSQKNQKTRRLPKCSSSTGDFEASVVMTTSSLEGSTKHKKEEASKILYITRI